MFPTLQRLFEKWFEKLILRARSARKINFSNNFSEMIYIIRGQCSRKTEFALTEFLIALGKSDPGIIEWGTPSGSRGTVPENSD
jgi:hypothetical protein